MADLTLDRPAQKRADSFTVDFVDNKAKVVKSSLQESFLKFKKERQKEIRREKKMRKRRKKKQRDPQAMLELRKKFLNQAKKYYGVPYAKKYWSPDTEEYYSKVFLDCCGLVRQVMYDLQKDFGFRLGPWNQAYMYDTLPITIGSEKDMKPGDLVFMSGIYPSPKARQQKHNMTHVEIWAGEGCKTIGARWNNGKVQKWDHYKFEAKSFHSAQYYFKSIDTWLMGICKSFCKEHKWKRRKFSPSKKSVFAMKKKDKIKDEQENALEIIGRGEPRPEVDEEEVPLEEEVDIPEEDLEYQDDDAEQEDENFYQSSGEEDNEDAEGPSDEDSDSADDINALPESMEALECQSSLSTNKLTLNMNGNAIDDKPTSNSSTSKEERTLDTKEAELDKTSENNVTATKDDEVKRQKKNNGKKSPGNRPTKLPSCSLPNNMQPTFYVGGGNGVALVEGPLTALGWKRTMDKHDERYRLKWTECKTKINYGAFKEGEQLVNHIPNGNLLTNKLGLLNSLQEYERVTLSTKGRPPRLRFADFVPETYRLDEKNDREVFLERYTDGELWICKPTGMNQGKGIFIIRTREELQKLLEERDQRREQLAKSSRSMMTRIVQRYIKNPLLLEGRKFDIRAYLLIASTSPFLVLYHKGYIRLCCGKYKEEDTEMSTHLTNQFVQKKDPNYKDLKENTAWSMDKFNQYINENLMAEKGLEENWAYNSLTKQMQKIMIHCFNSVKHKLQSRVGFFDLYGLDFMVDTDMRVWLIEVNVNPALHVNCEALKDVIPGVVEETLYVAIECFEKTRKNQQLLPMNSMKNFSVLYCGSRPYAMPARQARSVSPMKEVERKLSLSAPRPSSPVNHRTSTTSTAVSASQGKKEEEKDNTKKTEEEKEKDEKKKEKEPPYICSKTPEQPASAAAVLEIAGSLLSQSSTLLQNSSLLQESVNVKLKMMHGEKNTKSDSEGKVEREPTSAEEKSTKSKGVVLNLTSASSASVRSTAKGGNKTNTKDTSSTENDVSNIKPAVPVPSTTPTKAVKVTQSETYVSVLDSLKASSTADSNTSTKPASTTYQSKSAVSATASNKNNKSSITNVSSNSANANMRYSANFPVITNNSTTKTQKNSSNLTSLTRTPKEGVRASMNDGLISNPYTLGNEFSQTKSLQHSKSNAQQPYISISTASLKMTTSSTYSKPMSVPAVTLSDANLESHSLATFVLANPKQGRQDNKSGLRRSLRGRDRDKPDRGN